MERVIFLKVLATVNHCNNSCRWMSHDAKECFLFDRALVWDKRKKYNGAKRLKACKEAEVHQ